MITGIDISFWNGLLNWSVTRTVTTFAFVKSSQANYPDQCFASNWAGAKAAGVLRGAYHYLDYTMPPLMQAARMLTTLAGDLGELPPVIDFEEPVVPSGIVPLDYLRQWLDRVEAQTGRVPIIYTSPGYWRRYGSTDPAWARYPLWIAHYDVSVPIIPAPWTKYAFWQYTSAARGADYGAVNGTMDLNRFDGSLQDLYNFAQVTPPVSKEATMPVIPIIYKKIGPASWGFRPARNGPATDGTGDRFGLMVGAVVGIPDLRYLVSDPNGLISHDGSVCVWDLTRVDPNQTVALPLPQAPLAPGNYSHITPAEWQNIVSSNPYGPTPNSRTWLNIKDLVDDPSIPQPEGISMKVISTQGANLRPDKSTTSTPIKLLPYDYPVMVKGVTDDGLGNLWVMVEAQLYGAGYMALKYGTKIYLGMQ